VFVRRTIRYVFQQQRELHMNKDKQLTILLAGVGIGAAAGLLVARYSGADLRKGIRKRADEVKDLLNDRAEALVDRVQTAVEEGQGNLGSQLKKGKDAAREFSNKTRDVIETAAADTTNAAEEILNKSGAVASKTT
jgi:gas vesicle protein